MPSAPEYFVIFALLLLVVVAAFIRRAPMPPPESFQNFRFRKPILWWFVDADSNARKWYDFGARSSMSPNRGYLELALRAAERTQGRDFTVVPLIGRDAVLAQIPGAVPAAKQLPAALWRQYALTNLLAANGGLAMDGNSTLFIGPRIYPYVKSATAATFGVNPDEPIVDPVTAYAPGPSPYAGWAAEAKHPAWSGAAAFYNDLVARGPQSWSAAIARRESQRLWEVQKNAGAVLIRVPDGGRRPDGKARPLEDLFARTTPADTILPDTVFISYDGDDLARQFEFNWFLRMSPQQILDADFVWSQLAQSN